MTTTPAARDERKPVILGYGMWNTGTNPQTSLMRYDGMPIVHTEPRVGTVALVSIDDYNAQAQRAAIAQSELAEVREKLEVAGDIATHNYECVQLLLKERDELRAELERVKAGTVTALRAEISQLTVRLKNSDDVIEQIQKIISILVSPVPVAAIDAARGVEG